MLTQVDPKNVDWANMSLKDMAEGNAQDSFNTLKLYNILKVELEKLDLVSHYRTLLSPLIPVLAEIELRGMVIDTDKLNDLNPKLLAKVESIKAKLYEFPQTPPDTNVSSSRDLRSIFFLSENGFGLYPPFRTKKTGEPQLDANTLETLQNMIEEELESRHE